jgi:hypothetical protein
MNTAQLVKDISGSYDAFSRLRVSEPYTLFDSKLLYDKQPLLWDELEVSGSGTSCDYSSNEAMVKLNVSDNVPGKVVRQTFMRFNYQPGKSQLVMISGILGGNNIDIVKCIGQFDDYNGIFFKSNQDDYYIVKRSSTSGSPIDLEIPQSEWNKNRLDINSALTVDFNKAQVFYVNYEWLGLGDISCGLIIGNKMIELHQFRHANESTLVSMSKPNLPIRYEIENLGSGQEDSVKSVCSTVISEGGQANSGYIYAIDRGSLPISISVSSILYPVISIRLKSGRESANVFIENINIISTDNNVIFRWGLYLNPTFSGTALTYVDSYTKNFEYCSTSLNTTSISGGILLQSGYGIGTDTSINASSLAAKLSLGTYINGTPNVIVLAVERLDNQTNTFYAGMSIRDSA